MNRFAVLPAVLATLLLAACPSSKPPAPAPAPGADVASRASDGAGAPDAQALSAHHWSLVDAVDAAGARIDALFPRADKPVQLDFADGHVAVSNACNHINGRYALDGATLAVDQLVQTEMACEAPLMQLDQAIGERLAQGGTLRLEGADTLVYVTASGDTLRFAGAPTADTRYGGPGERVFLEVAAQRVPCPHAMIPDHQCLHVREVGYDDNGRRRSAGDWEFLYQDIEGYAHEPGIRNVLRLKRYSVAQPPADGSSIAYVLDMVVESERVQP